MLVGRRRPENRRHEAACLIRSSFQVVPLVEKNQGIVS